MPHTLRLPSDVVYRLILQVHAVWLENVLNRHICPWWMVSQVSREWRAIALSIPTVWATIDVRHSHPGECDRTVAFLQRSGSAPLDVEVYGFKQCFTIPGIRVIGALLSREISRVRNFRAQSMDPLHLSTLVDFAFACARPATILEGLVLDATSPVSPQDLQTRFLRAFGFPEGFPVLRSLASTNVPTNLWCCISHNLTHLKIQPHKLDLQISRNVLVVLRECQSLEELAIHAGKSPQNDTEPTQAEAQTINQIAAVHRIHVPNLRTLTLFDLRRFYATFFLNAIVYPAGTKVQIYSLREDCTWPLPSLIVPACGFRMTVINIRKVNIGITYNKMDGIGNGYSCDFFLACHNANNDLILCVGWYRKWNLDNSPFLHTAMIDSASLCFPNAKTAIICVRFNSDLGPFMQNDWNCFLDRLPSIKELQVALFNCPISQTVSHEFALWLRGSCYTLKRLFVDFHSSGAEDSLIHAQALASCLQQRARERVYLDALGVDFLRWHDSLPCLAGLARNVRCWAGQLN